MNIFEFQSPIAIHQIISNIGYATTPKELSSSNAQDELRYLIICTPGIYPDTLQRIQKTLQEYPDINFIPTSHTIQNLNLNSKWYKQHRIHQNEHKNESYATDMTRIFGCNHIWETSTKKITSICEYRWKVVQMHCIMICSIK